MTDDNIVARDEARAEIKDLAGRRAQCANESQEELIKEADDFDWQCENGRWLAVRLVEEIQRLTRELEQERKNCLRVSYERDEAIREIGTEGRKRGHAEAERDDVILRAEAAERKVEKLRRLVADASATLKETESE